MKRGHLEYALEEEEKKTILEINITCRGLLTYSSDSCSQHLAIFWPSVSFHKPDDTGKPLLQL